MIFKEFIAPCTSGSILLFHIMNPAGFPHFIGQICSFIAYLCGCGQGCGHMAWPYDVACYGSFQVTKLANLSYGA